MTQAQPDDVLDPLPYKTPKLLGEGYVKVEVLNSEEPDKSPLYSITATTTEHSSEDSEDPVAFRSVSGNMDEAILKCVRRLLDHGRQEESKQDITSSLPPATAQGEQAPADQRNDG